MPHFLWFSLGEWFWICVILAFACAMVYGVAVTNRNIEAAGCMVVPIWFLCVAAQLTGIVWIILFIIDYAKR